MTDSIKLRLKFKHPLRTPSSFPKIANYSLIKAISAATLLIGMPNISSASDDFCKPAEAFSEQDYSEVLPYADKLGWVRTEDLPDDLDIELSGRCDGFYIDRARTTKNNPNAAIAVEADSASTSPNQQLNRFQGNVLITQQGNEVQANTACYDRSNSDTSLFGDVLVKHSGLNMVGDQADINLDTNIGRINNGLFAVSAAHLRGQSEQIDFDFQDTKQYVELTEGYITFCEPSSNAWKLDADDIKLDFEEGWGSASNIKIKVQDVPVFYLPWMNFPLDDRRKTGFLYPSYEISSGALALTTPYYLNLAPNYDMTLRPSYYEDRGEMIAAEFRYLNEWGINRFDGGFLKDDDDYPDSDTRAITGEEAGEDRWSFHYDHLGKIMGWRTEVDFNRVSDDDYRSDFGGILRSSHDGTVDQTAEATWTDGTIALSARLRSYQITDETEIASDQYKQLPDLLFSGNWSHGSNLRSDVQLNTTYFERVAESDELNIREQNETVGSAARFYSRTSLNYDMRNTWGYLIPGVTLYASQYELDEYQSTYFDDSANTVVPSAHINAGIFLERPSRLFNTHFTQTLEPQLMYAYIPFEDQSDVPVFDSEEADLTYNQLFKPNRFTGRDRIGDTSQITLGVTSRTLNEQGRQILSARTGTIVYLKDRKVDLTNDHDGSSSDPKNNYETSNYVTEVRYTPFEEWSYQADFEWDNQESRAERNTHKIAYRPDPEYIATLRYNRRTNEDTDEPEEFVEFSTAWQFDPFWSIFHRYEFDAIKHRTSDILNGVEYNNCCWRASLIFRRFDTGDQELVGSGTDTRLRDEFDNGIFFRFELKGLADFGGKTQSLLDELIEDIDQRNVYDY